VGLFRERHPSVILVTGHTDILGTRSANQALSERRAAVVKSFLASAGLSAASIITRAVGEDDLLVQTADEVREKQNDYVDLEFRP
jgi:outer membrane protein OmpA-like peptidoglycan-associated protein